MAIVEINTQNYYKLNLDKCIVQDNSIMLDILIYKNENSRKLRKQTKYVFERFIESLHKYIEKIIANIKLKFKNVSDASEIPQDDIDIKLIQRLEQYENYFKQYLLGYPVPTIEIDMQDNTLLKELGFNEKWICEESEILGGYTINAGQYKGEELTPSFFYAKLAEYMNSSIKSC